MATIRGSGNIVRQNISTNWFWTKNLVNFISEGVHEVIVLDEDIGVLVPAADKDEEHQK